MEKENYESNLYKILAQIRHQNNHFEKDDNDSINPHATAVMSIICGTKQAYENDFYQGIAPGASMYFSSRDTWKTVNNELICPPLQWLIIDNACHVVAMSSTPGYVELYGTYSIYEEYMKKGRVLQSFVHDKETIVTGIKNKGD